MDRVPPRYRIHRLIMSSGPRRPPPGTPGDDDPPTAGTSPPDGREPTSQTAPRTTQPMIEPTGHRSTDPIPSPNSPDHETADHGTAVGEACAARPTHRRLTTHPLDEQQFSIHEQPPGRPRRYTRSSDRPAGLWNRPRVGDAPPGRGPVGPRPGALGAPSAGVSSAGLSMGQATVQLEPLRLKEVAAAALPVWVAWKPMLTDALGAIAPLYAAFRAVTCPELGA